MSLAAGGMPPAPSINTVMGSESDLDWRLSLVPTALVAELYQGGRTRMETHHHTSIWV